MISATNSVPFMVASLGNELGAWDDKGIEVENIYASSSTAGPTLAANEADLSLQAGNKAAGDAVAGIQTTVVAADLLPWVQHLVASKDSGVEKPEDLKGKRFGISSFGAAGHYATLKMADTLGWSEDDFEIVQLGGPQEILAAMEKGTIDAFVWSIEPALTAQERGFGTMIGTVEDLVGPNAFEAFSARTEFAENNSEQMQAYFEGYFETVKELQADPERAIELVVDEWDMDPEVARQAVTEVLPLLSTDGVIPEEELEGLEDSVRVTIKDAGDDFDINDVYTYWKDFG